jgi:pyridoxamine 5'-phosphate oxidase family protein
VSAFTPAEIEYLNTQRLGRLATVGKDGTPHVMPVGFRYNADSDTIDIGGHNMGGSKKWRDIGREPRVAFVVDDVLPPWRPRLIEIRGEAVRLSSGGAGMVQGFSDELIRIRPTRVVSFGIDVTEVPRNFKVTGRDVDTSASLAKP